MSESVWEKGGGKGGGGRRRWAEGDNGKRRKGEGRADEEGSFEVGAADLQSEIRYPSSPMISQLFGEIAVGSSSPYPS